MSGTAAGIAQALLLVVALGLVWRFLGDHMARALGGDRHLAFERRLYRAMGVDPDAEQKWSTYLRSVLAFSLISVLFLYLLERVQHHLPYSLGFDSVPPALAWNTAVSFVTNTNWQAYSGESTMGYVVQMTGLAVQNFVSAAVGIAVVVALIHGLTRSRTERIGNFWVDLIRVILRILLPLAVVGAVVLMAGGVVQNFLDRTPSPPSPAQADSLRASTKDTTARRLLLWHPGANTASIQEEVPSTTLTLDDVVVVEAGQTVPGDGDVVEGVASVDESAITGESAPVIRESGGDRSAVTGGTQVLSDRIVVRITSKPGDTFIDRMIALVEGASRQKTPNEIALNILLASLTIIFLLAVATLQPLAIYSNAAQSIVVLAALVVALIPTTIGALLSVIGIAGMDRLVQRNVLAMSGRAVEAAGDVNTLLLDKTGTITLGNRCAVEFLPVDEVGPIELAEAARLASLADETPEGRSIVVLADEQRTGGRRVDEATQSDPAALTFVPFAAQTRMSGVDLDGADGSPGRQVRKGAAASVAGWIRESGGTVPASTDALVEGISDAGGTPLVVAERGPDGPRVLGVVYLKDVVKPGMAERFAELRRMGIRTAMMTGDNRRTAEAIGAEAGVDDILAEATPEDKMALIVREQEGGRLVAMTGDGTNDAPALAKADVGVAMNTGTSAAKEAGNMVDLDSNPTKLIEIVAIGKQLLITRGSLTTFSVANDVAKYFAILPAMFAGTFPGLGRLNLMALSLPQSAITSAITFNALIIVALVPLALRGVRYRPASAASMLRRNLTIYGLGGLVLPFVGIKMIDLVIHFVPGIG